VVDDDPEFCRTFREHLVRKGYQVVLAYSGEEALVSYVENQPDVVFLDVRMPGKNGIETLRELKAIDPNAAVIMVSAVEDHDIVEQAKSLGVFYVNKPINFRYLEHAIETTLGLRRGIVSSLG
jgi:two-component system response regulator (stage 0 sporulation protein F)